MVFMELILIDCFSVFVKCFYKYMVRELVRYMKSDNEIYLLIKYIKSVLWRVAKRLSCIENARCLKVKALTRT